MPSRNELVMRANVLGFDPTTIANDSKLEQHILYLEKNATAINGALATGVLTASGVFQNNETVTIGGKVYKFVDALSETATPYEVLIGAAAADSLDNLKSAINGTAGAGTTYGEGTPVHPQVTATTNTDTAQTVQARDMAVTNGSIGTTETCANVAWGATTLASGTADQNAAAATNGQISGDRNQNV